MKAEEISRQCEAIVKEVGRVIVGKEDAMRTVILAVLADGHILMEDFPGLAKTLMAKCFAQTLGLEFKRVQFTPDLLPADITGTYIFDRKAGDFFLRRGPVFTNVLLADEINRAPPKTQAALLEAMQERQTTLAGETHPLDRPFIVIATQNPIEYEGTYPLPEAQIDRFLIRMAIGYPGPEEEKEILDRRRARGTDEAVVQKIVDGEALLAMQKGLEGVHVADDVERYMVELVRRTRAHPQVEIGASPRGSLALLKLSRARAALEGRDFVIPDDVKAVGVPALAHRLILKPDPWVKGVKTQSIVMEIMNQVPVPKVK